MQRKVKVDRRKSSSLVKSKIESELEIIISEQIVLCRLYEVGFKDHIARKTRTYMRVRKIESSVLNKLERSVGSRVVN